MGATGSDPSDRFYMIDFKVHETQLRHRKPQSIPINASQCRAGDDESFGALAKGLGEAIEPVRTIRIGQGNA